MGIRYRFVEFKGFPGRQLRFSEGRARSRDPIVRDDLVTPGLDGVGTSVCGLGRDRLIGISNAGLEIRPGAPTETKLRSQQRLIGGRIYRR